MINFKSFLNEGRDAPLYHGTSREALLSILRMDVLRTSLSHGESSQRIAKPDNKVISLTRSLTTARNWKYDGIILQLDQRKLTQNYKLKPINIQYHWTGGTNHSKEEHLFEEYVTSDIKPLSKYLTAIIVTRSGLEELEYMATKEYRDEEATKYERAKYQAVINHPLLYSYERKTFINK